MDLLNFIGNTPLVRLKRSSPKPDVNIYAKLELCNPTGSLKDRIAHYMIEQAEKRGELRPGMTIIEATSGNTGIALGMVAAVKGYKLKLFMLESKTIERRKMLRYWGADLQLTTGEDPDSHIYAAKDLIAARPDKYYYIDQNENEDNVWAHYYGTGKEIAEQLEGKIDVFIAGYGTGGTLVGVARYFMDRGIDARIVAVEPEGPMGGIDGLKHSAEAYQPPIYDRNLMDDTICVSSAEAVGCSKEIASKEGIIAGISSGAALRAAQQVAERMERGNLVVLFADRGERYFSTDLFNFE